MSLHYNSILYKTLGLDSPIPYKKFLCPKRARSHENWIVKPLQLPLVHETWYNIEKLNLNQIIPGVFISAS